MNAKILFVFFIPNCLFLLRQILRKTISRRFLDAFHSIIFFSHMLQFNYSSYCRGPLLLSNDITISRIIGRIKCEVVSILSVSDYKTHLGIINKVSCAQSVTIHIIGCPVGLQSSHTMPLFRPKNYVHVLQCSEFISCVPFLFSITTS